MTQDNHNTKKQRAWTSASGLTTPTAPATCSDAPPIVSDATPTPQAVAAVRQPPATLALVCWSLLWGLAVSTLVAMLAYHLGDARPQLDHWGQWPTFLLYWAMSAGAAWPLACWFVYLHLRNGQTEPDRRAFTTAAVCSCLGAPLGMAAWGGWSIWPWSLSVPLSLLFAIACYKTIPALLGVSSLDHTGAAAQVRQPFSLRLALFYALFSAAILGFVCTLYNAPYFYAELLLARTSIDTGQPAFRFMALAMVFTFNLSSIFLRVFRPDQALRVSITLFLFALAALAAESLYTFDDLGWKFPIIFSLILAVVFYHILDSKQ